VDKSPGGGQRARGSAMLPPPGVQVGAGVEGTIQIRPGHKPQPTFWAPQEENGQGWSLTRLKGIYWP